MKMFIDIIYDAFAAKYMFVHSDAVCAGREIKVQ